MTATPTCATCRFWNGKVSGQWRDVVSICRRHAPVVDRKVTTNELTGVWPTVLADAWCGEHQPREETT